MQKDNIVSLWLGNFNSDEKFKKFMDVDYTDDGDLIPSIFQKSFKIEDYDIDFSEINYKETKSNDLKILLKGASYDYEIIDKFSEEYANKLNKRYYNTVVLLYNFGYSGEIKNVKIDNNEIEYIGITSYKK